MSQRDGPTPSEIFVAVRPATFTLEGEMASHCQNQGIGLERRQALEMLADEPGGCNEEELSAYHGFETLAGLVRDGLATAQLETMRAGGQTIEVARARITDKGWKALICPAKSQMA
jgi:hypothetical protein